MDRALLEAEWLTLTRETLPGIGGARGWPIRADHCFQRVLLDHAVGGCWYDHVVGRPAYRTIDDARLAAAIALGRSVAAGTADIVALNDRSLAWRGKPRRGTSSPDGGQVSREASRPSPSG